VRVLQNLHSAFTGQHLMGFDDGSRPAIGYRDAQQLEGDAKNAIKVEY
jgi:hypothetical protein